MDITHMSYPDKKCQTVTFTRTVAGFQVSRVPRGFSCTGTRKTGPLSPNNNYCTMLRQYFEKTVPGVY